MSPSGLLLFAKGVGLGFSIAAPVGPIGLLCLRRTLAHGRLSGFVSGLGAATADACYGSVAGFGLTAIAAFLVRQETILRTVGGLFLLYLGIRTMLARPARQAADAADDGLLKDYVSTLALTLTNPFTILAFAAIFSGLGIVRAQSQAAAGLLVLGVFLGSSLWWYLLSTVAEAARRRFGEAFLRGVSLVSGLAIIGFGGVTLAELVRPLVSR